jgi:hypothetical protein
MKHVGTFLQDGGQTTMHRNPLMSSEELEARKISCAH